MQQSTRHLAIGSLALALASLIAYAQSSRQDRLEAREWTSPDLLPGSSQRRLSMSAQQAVQGEVAASAPTIEDVGDIDSFGREVIFLGVTQMNVTLNDTCPVPGGDPDGTCVALNPAPAVTTFAFEDLARITLPGKSAHSLLCYWFSPFLNVRYSNPTATPALARLRYSPTLTVENPVLDDPALVDPTTGLPFGGELLTGMTSSEWFEVNLGPGQQQFERTRDSAVCIAGFLSRRALVDTFGLTDAQATRFFKEQTTVRMNLSGSAQYVQDATLIYGLRIVGDKR